MSAVRTIGRNTSVLFVSQVVNLGIGFVYLVWMTRYLGPDEYGVLSFALAFTAMLAVFADFGLSTLATREVARDLSLARRYFGNFTSIKVCLAAVTFGLIALLTHLLGYPEQTITVVYLIGLAAILSNFTSFFNSLFQAFEKMEYQAFGSIFNTFLMLIGIVLAISYGLDVVWFAAVYLISSAIVLGYSTIITARKFFVIKFKFEWALWGQWIKEALPFGLSAIFALIFFYVDTVILSIMKGDTAVGLYSASYRLVWVLLALPGVYFTAVFPVLVKLHVTSMSSLRTAYAFSSKFTLLIIAPIAIFVTLLPSEIISFVYGKSFLESASVLAILIWAVFFSFLCYTPMFTLNATNDQRYYTKVVFFGLLLNLALNLILIPPLSYIGAGIVTVISQIFVFGFIFHRTKRFLQDGIPSKLIAKLAIACTILALFIFYFDYVNLLMLSIASATLYLSSLVLLGVLTKKEYALIKSAFSREKTQT